MKSSNEGLILYCYHEAFKRLRAGMRTRGEYGAISYLVSGHRRCTTADGRERFDTLAAEYLSEGDYALYYRKAREEG